MKDISMGIYKHMLFVQNTNNINIYIIAIAIIVL